MTKGWHNKVNTYKKHSSDPLMLHQWKLCLLYQINNLTNLECSCTDRRKFCIFGVGPTYNVGPCYVTRTTYCHLQVLTKKREHPVMMGPPIIHSHKIRIWFIF